MWSNALTMERRFENKVALVTGAGAGIGRATAKAFASEGARTIVADVSHAGGTETVRQIREAGGEAAFVCADVSRAADCEAMVAKAVELYGRLDCAHNNAGIPGTRVRTADRSEEEWDRTMSVNLKGVWLAMKYELPAMLKNRSGAIVNTSSVAGLVGMWKLSAYSASKHAVIGLTKSAALEYCRHGIRVNAVCPGLIYTDLVRDAAAGGKSPAAPARRLVARALEPFVKSLLSSRQPSGRAGSPEEVAAAVLWLCSDAAAYVNGQALAVDGGFTAK